jgi:hypothetical protein
MKSLKRGNLITFDTCAVTSPLKGRVPISKGPGQDSPHYDDWRNQQDQNGKVKRLLGVWGLSLGGQLAHGATLCKRRNLPLQEDDSQE